MATMFPVGPEKAEEIMTDMALPRGPALFLFQWWPPLWLPQAVSSWSFSQLLFVLPCSCITLVPTVLSFHRKDPLLH